MLRLPKRRNPHALIGLIGVVTIFGLGRPAQAAGLLIADGGFGGSLEIVDHRVQVTINNGIAVTEVVQVFRNLENRQVEALYTFPVPKRASVSDFSMWIDGREMIGEVVEKERAREIYDSYKRRNIDPGLLEQVDYKTFEMRIFPIAPRAEQKVRVTYYQELDHDHDRVTYTYPLATVTRPDVDARARGTFALSVDIKSEIPILGLSSPSHPDTVVFATHDPLYDQASLEQPEGTLDRDVVIAYQLSRPKTGLDLITSREKGDDGYLCLLLTVGEDFNALEVGSDYVFILDVSGSMARDGKLRLSRNSVAAFTEALGPRDRFEIVTFNVSPTPLFGGLREVSEESRARTTEFLGSHEARGGTMLNSAVELAYRYGDPDRTLNVVVLSDGMTEQRAQDQLHELIRKRPGHARVFCIGIGNEVNRPLLEKIAQDAGGLAAFLSPGDDFKRQARAFRRKLTHAVATDVRVNFKGGSVYDVEPRSLPNLFHGTPIRIYGRYREAGPVKIEVRAEVAGRSFETVSELDLPEVDDSNPQIERMWAWNRIDRLLKEAKSERTPLRKAEVIALGEEYSIVSEYTSFIVLENDQEYRRWKIERRNLRRMERDRNAQRKLALQLAAMRTKAVADLGPQAAKESPRTRPQPVTRRDNRAPAQRPPQREASRRRSSDVDLGGTGPVGPLFVAGAYWLARRRRRLRMTA